VGWGCGVGGPPQTPNPPTPNPPIPNNLNKKNKKFFI